MPRDLGLEGHEDSASQDLSLHPETSLGTHATQPPPYPTDSVEDEYDDEEEEYAEHGVLDDVDIVGESTEILKQLHPYAQLLGLADLDSCFTLEETAFDEAERGSKAKFTYRLTRCSELCLGLFTSAGSESPEQQALTAPTANATDSSDPDRKTVLIAMLIATKSTNDKVTEEDMKVPQNWEENSIQESPLGHKEHGRTIMVHSLAVLPGYQTKGLGSILMKSYIQRMVEAENADRIALLAHEPLIHFYENLGFQNKGKSNVEFGGGGWYDMVLEFDDVRPTTEEDE